MIALKNRLHVTVLALALTLVAGIGPASAETVKIPNEKPALTVDLPDGWTHEVAKDGVVSCVPPDNSKGFYTLLVMPMENVHSKADAKKQLPAFIKDFAAGAKIADFQTADMDDVNNSNDVSFYGMVGKGVKKEIAAVVVVSAFEAQKGKWYVVATLGTEAGDKAYTEEYTTIVDSIRSAK